MGSFFGHSITAWLDLKDRKGESVKPSKSAEEVDSFPFPGLWGTGKGNCNSGDAPDEPEPKKLPGMIIEQLLTKYKTGLQGEPLGKQF